MRDYTESQRWYERAILATPFGSQTMSKQPARYGLGGMPHFAKYGNGARLFDLDGYAYVDWVCALACLTLGYNHRDVVKAVRSQALDGPIFSLPSRLEAQVAERVCALFPLAEQARWVKTGSEASEAAVRIARRATGREFILSVGYHSWHSAFMAAKEQHPGVPEDYAIAIEEVPYGDLDAVRQFIGEECAAVILEPCLSVAPPDGYLEGVIDLAHQHGALVIFDEVVTGFRWATGGAQEYFGVPADLTTVGKALASGYPLAAILGPRDLMHYADVVSGTFSGDCVALAAANATLDVYEREPIISNLWRDGGWFQALINRTCADLGIVADGYAVHPMLHAPDDLTLARFVEQCAEYGVLVHPGGCNVCGVLDASDRLATEDGIVRAAAALRAGVPLRGRIFERAVWRNIATQPLNGEAA